MWGAISQTVSAWYKPDAVHKFIFLNSTETSAAIENASSEDQAKRRRVDSTNSVPSPRQQRRHDAQSEMEENGFRSVGTMKPNEGEVPSWDCKWFGSGRDKQRSLFEEARIERPYNESLDTNSISRITRADDSANSRLLKVDLTSIGRNNYNSILVQTQNQHKIDSDRGGAYKRRRDDDRGMNNFPQARLRGHSKSVQQRNAPEVENWHQDPLLQGTAKIVNQIPSRGDIPSGIGKAKTSTFHKSVAHQGTQISSSVPYSQYPSHIRCIFDSALRDKKLKTLSDSQVSTALRSNTSTNPCRASMLHANSAVGLEKLRLLAQYHKQNQQRRAKGYGENSEGYEQMKGSAHDIGRMKRISLENNSVSDQEARIVERQAYLEEGLQYDDDFMALAKEKVTNAASRRVLEQGTSQSGHLEKRLVVSENENALHASFDAEEGDYGERRDNDAEGEEEVRDQEIVTEGIEERKNDALADDGPGEDMSSSDGDEDGVSERCDDTGLDNFVEDSEEYVGTAASSDSEDSVDLQPNVDEWKGQSEDLPELDTVSNNGQSEEILKQVTRSDKRVETQHDLLSMGKHKTELNSTDLFIAPSEQGQNARDCLLEMYGGQGAGNMLSMESDQEDTEVSSEEGIEESEYSDQGLSPARGGHAQEGDDCVIELVDTSSEEEEENSSDNAECHDQFDSVGLNEQRATDEESSEADTGSTVDSDTSSGS